MKYLLPVFLMALSGCALSGLRTAGRTSQEPVAASELMHLVNADKLLNRGRYAEALPHYQAFQHQYPQSVFYQAARLGEAQSLSGLEQWQEALEIYRDITLKTRIEQPKIAALAFYKMSFAWEALGDDLKTVAALLDAQRLGSYLPLETAVAEIPARLAAIYARQGREREAVAYLNEAEKGLEEVQNKKGTQYLLHEWRAKTYVQMGSVSTNQLAASTFTPFVRGQILVQTYLLRALRLNDKVWSPMAREILQRTYRDLFATIESQSESRELQLAMGAELLGLIDQADLYRPLPEQKMNTPEQDFFSFLTDVRKRTETLVYDNRELMGLTAESQSLNSLKRAGRVKSDALLPEEEKSSISLPPKVVPLEDPNL